MLPTAGRGTRLLPATKEQPKEMLPVFAANHGILNVVPILQLIFEQLYGFGMKRFCFVVGREKRAIENHFTFDPRFVPTPEVSNESTVNTVLEFHHMVQKSSISWVNQPEPLGFGHAVLTGESAMSGGPFLVHAGDTIIYSEGNSHLSRLIEAHERFESEATLLLRETSNPRHYGVAEVQPQDKALRVTHVVEKPSRPRSNLAVMPVYVFNPSIFEALRNTKKGIGGEFQLTDGIQRLIDKGLRVSAVKLRKDELRLDIGNPEYYWEALKVSYNRAKASIRH